ncbi:MAG: TolC family protein [Prevotella sp.]|nr:TolC family protein [Prevotella sp.]
MKRLIGLILLSSVVYTVEAQRVLSLDSCRAMALRNNKQMSVQRVKQEVAKNIRKSARTKYLPHVSAAGGYLYTSKEISLLSDESKETLSNLGTNGVKQMQTGLASAMPVLSALFGGTAPVTSMMSGMAGTLNQIGQGIVDELHTDTRHMFGGAVLVTQPIFMGGAIIALNKMADLGEELAANSAEARRQETLYQIDQAYWQVVSLRHKQRLAEGFLGLVKKLDGDVQKMIREGVATRSEGLSVSVKVNEAEMAVMKVNDGLTLSKMLLCQLCGLPVDEQITLADEETEQIVTVSITENFRKGDFLEYRPELKMLQNVVDISHQSTNLLKAANLPQVLLVGGYSASNPNVYNGFQRKFSGAWNIAVMMRVPIWNWGDVAYKVRAAKGATAIATLELEEAREKMELQVSQSNFRVNEANKKLEMAKASQQKAEENLRTANLGFQEGVISSTTVMEAQTAWLQAQSQLIDAEIDVQLSRVNLQKSLGTLR